MINKIDNPYIPETFDAGYPKCQKSSDNVPMSWLTKYTSVTLPTNPLRYDITGAYTPQGGCVDGAYIYRALVKEDNEPAIIQKIRLTNGEVVAEASGVYGHCNDMFVKGDILYVLHSSSTNIVYRLSKDNLEFLGLSQTGPTRWGQAYNATDDLEVIGTVGSAYFSVYNNGKFMYRIKPDNAYSALVRQGIFCSDNYIAVVLDNHYGAVEGDTGTSRIMFYTWNGMFVQSVNIPIKEIEWADYKDGILYVGTYEGRDKADVKSGFIYDIPFDLYPDQTVLTGRPTEVSGGLNNLQRLPEGTPVRLWDGEQSTGVITLDTINTRLRVDEDGPFRYIKFEFDAANSGTFDWWPKNNGVVCLREFDITAAASDSNIRFREMRLTFNATAQTFTIESNLVEQLLSDVSENTLKMTKSPEGIDGITVRSIWGIV